MTNCVNHSDLEVQIQEGAERFLGLELLQTTSIYKTFVLLSKQGLSSTQLPGNRHFQNKTLNGEGLQKAAPVAMVTPFTN